MHFDFGHSYQLGHGQNPWKVLKHLFKYIATTILSLIALTAEMQAEDVIYTDSTKTVGKKNFVTTVIDFVDGIISPPVDTTFIEYQKYNWAVMMQGSASIENYSITNNDYTISYTPDVRYSVGPYFGWRWLFLGYTFDLGANRSEGNTNINLNFYSSAFGFNFMFRRTNDFKINRLSVGDTDLSHNLSHFEAPRLKAGNIGLNVYYVPNYRHYSHQAIYSQTNRQLRSGGSLVIGGGINMLDFKCNRDKFSDYVYKLSDGKVSTDIIDFDSRTRYATATFTLGCGYNWAFARNWAVGAQLTGSLSGKWSGVEVRKSNNFFRDNLAKDVSLRMGIVWNNSKWFAGSNILTRSYTSFGHDYLSIHSFGTLNVYVGYNFGIRK